MTGWRLGYMCAPLEVIQACVRLQQYTVVCAPSFCQEAAITALEDCDEDVEIMRKEYQRRKDYVVKALNEIDGISCNNPQGAFYIFVNIKSLGKSSQEVAEYMLEHAKIALVPGSAFGSEGEGYLRISYATSYEDLVEACDRIKKAVAELKNN
jgi:aspartate/methionine/tyrosine aminotransferase